MEIYGNVGNLKKAIEQKYQEQIDNINKEVEARLKDIDKGAKNKISLKQSRIQTLTAAEVRKAVSKVTSSEHLRAKKSFEEKREEMINEIFSIAMKKAATIAHSKQYVDFLKKNMPELKKLDITADSAFYKKAFPKAGITVDSSIMGVKIRAGDINYDFTLDGAIKSQKDILRNKISHELFG